MLKSLMILPIILATGVITASAVETKTQPPCTGECAKSIPTPRGVILNNLDSRFAVINSNGTFARGDGVSSVARLGLGTYQVIFNRNVTRCVYTATIGPAAAAGVPAGVAGVAPRAGNVNGVFVQTRNLAGAGADLPFYLYVGC